MMWKSCDPGAWRNCVGKFGENNFLEKSGHQGPHLQWPVHHGNEQFYWKATTHETLDIYIWHIFWFWHILSSNYDILYILLYCADSSCGIHIFMYVLIRIILCVRNLIYIYLVSLLSYSSNLSTHAAISKYLIVTTFKDVQASDLCICWSA